MHSTDRAAALAPDALAVVRDAPRYSVAQAARVLQELYGFGASLRPLPSERDQNFVVDVGDGPAFVFKLANAREKREALEAQNAAMQWIAARDPSLATPRPCETPTGATISRVDAPDGRTHFARLLTWVRGVPLADVGPYDARLLESLGWMLGRLDTALEGFDHPGAKRVFHWDLAIGSAVVARYLADVGGAARRRLLEGMLDRFERALVPALAELRRGVIHNDANDYNVLVRYGRVVGVVDFGDMVESCLACEPAVGAAYALLGRDDPVSVARRVARGYHATFGLTRAECDILPDLVALRLCMSVAISAAQRKAEPDNAYLTISERAAWAALERLARVDAESARDAYRTACTIEGTTEPVSKRTREAILGVRRRHLGRGLTLHYDEPLHMVRGWMQFLYDADGREYLDLVNNVCHVGHSHPEVVEAARRQWSRLNTNTRYLYDELAEYLERLTASFPEPLTVCYLVCSGSEANELALRLARAHTGRRDVVVVDHGYHGNTTTLVELSPYKYKGPGGAGRPDWVHEVAMPDVYRGRWRDSETAGGEYAAEVESAVERGAARGGVAAFICESLLGCGGQVVLPDAYLAAAYAAVRGAGGVCIADEVQVGFGRVGSHVWAFETQGVVPDIVTLGKPIGNGHPLGAVITTPAIAGSFDTGMEYFNTFGGNPVSCAVGLAVLDVMQQEGLQERARVAGDRLLAGLRDLQAERPAIGDVRGMGLFLGVELVQDRDTREPARELAKRVVEGLKTRGILMATEGPGHNVLKIKPPLQVTEGDVDRMVGVLSEILADM